MDGLLDASIVVDIYRGYSAAAAWVNANKHLRLAVTPVTWMEVVAGAGNKVNQRKVIRLLDMFLMEELEKSDINWAMQQLQMYRLSHGIDIPDCLIAAPSYRLQLPLYTRNLKHFTPLLGALAMQPYS